MRHYEAMPSGSFAYVFLILSLGATPTIVRPHCTLETLVLSSSLLNTGCTPTLGPDGLDSHLLRNPPVGEG